MKNLILLIFFILKSNLVFANTILDNPLGSVLGKAQDIIDKQKITGKKLKKFLNNKVIAIDYDGQIEFYDFRDDITYFVYKNKNKIAQGNWSIKGLTKSSIKLTGYRDIYFQIYLTLDKISTITNLRKTKDNQTDRQIVKIINKKDFKIEDTKKLQVNQSKENKKKKVVNTNNQEKESSNNKKEKTLKVESNTNENKKALKSTDVLIPENSAEIWLSRRANGEFSSAESKKNKNNYESLDELIKNNRTFKFKPITTQPIKNIKLWLTCNPSEGFISKRRANSNFNYEVFFVDYLNKNRLTMFVNGTNADDQRYYEPKSIDKIVLQKDRYTDNDTNARYVAELSNRLGSFVLYMNKPLSIMKKIDDKNSFYFYTTSTNQTYLDKETNTQKKEPVVGECKLKKFDLINQSLLENNDNSNEQTKEKQNETKKIIQSNIDKDILYEIKLTGSKKIKDCGIPILNYKFKKYEKFDLKWICEEGENVNINGIYQGGGGGFSQFLLVYFYNGKKYTDFYRLGLKGDTVDLQGALFSGQSFKLEKISENYLIK